MFFRHAFLPFLDALGIPMMRFGADTRLLVGFWSVSTVPAAAQQLETSGLLNTATVTQLPKLKTVLIDGFATSALPKQGSQTATA
jgi:hypothetical protein